MKILSLLAALVALSLVAHAANRPSIVFILADDLGYTDVACYGGKFYETPNIDRLAEQGMRFTPVGCDDLGETKDLAATMPAKAGELREKLHAWRQKLRAPMPTKNMETTPTGSASKPKRKKQGGED